MQRAGRREVAFGRRAVERYVAGVEHEVGPVRPQCSPMRTKLSTKNGFSSLRWLSEICAIRKVMAPA
jgi:hypothetical protein